jgi:hypothetical protein
MYTSTKNKISTILQVTYRPNFAEDDTSNNISATMSSNLMPYAFQNIFH